MQSILGALLTAGYAASAAALISSSGKNVSTNVANELTKSFAGAQSIAKQYPQYATQITAAAKTSFLQGDTWAYLAGIIAVLVGGRHRLLLLPAGRAGAGPARLLRPRGWPGRGDCLSQGARRARPRRGRA